MKIKTLLFCLLSVTAFAQTENKEDKKVDLINLNWHNKDAQLDRVPGISTERAYDELLKGKRSHPVVVAVIDGGVDTAHEDLKARLWINTKEIPGNGVDDDGNGYIDDIHGWNFLGNAKGENINHETLELTRLYKKYVDRFGDKTLKLVPEAEREEYKKYQLVAADYLSKLLSVKQEQLIYLSFIDTYNTADSAVKAYLKREAYTDDDLKAIKSYKDEINDAANTLLSFRAAGLTPDEVMKDKKRVDEKADFYLNPDYNPRRDIIGDNPAVLNDMKYGNNDVTGPDASHGTFVSGIIGAVRNNALGPDGIADNVQIMAVRAVPDGDERDKDVANAIRYAVDNGASIINMSFGKDYSPQKQLVDEALQYAAAKNVLLVHAAGNDAKDLDKENNFPSSVTLDNKPVATMITVGAVSRRLDQKFVADFSNYGRTNVDLFAPGVAIYSLKPGNKYETGNGTSYASPMVAGVAAMLKSYYPDLTAVDLKRIITESGISYGKMRVYIPSEKGHSRKKKFYKLSVTGTELNAYNAVKMAEELIKGK